jgi:wyosine [tRNA(Phe)-imidazoG37] synthetase (radical SAM superfamily)
MIAFGPVPSRRLGRSLGINNIPPKMCTYSCIYCQIGRTIKIKVDRRKYYEPEQVLESVQKKVEKAIAKGELVDYLTFVPDGEPTLDINLGREIELLSNLDTKIAIITNASLLWRGDVREELMKADYVSVKVDTVKEDTWRKVNRPSHKLKLNHILDGILEFSKVYQGELTTETMLVKDINDQEKSVKEIADFLIHIKPTKVYLSIPIRPPAEREVEPPDEVDLNRAFQVFNESLNQVEYLIGYEGNAFASTGNLDEDILSITSVHPIREDAMRELLEKEKSNWSKIHDLIDQNLLSETKYKGNKFYIRKFTRRF